MSRILITGSTGFIGRNLVTYFLKNTEHDLFLINRNRKITHKGKNIINFYYDQKITNLISFFNEVRPEIVIHLATNYVKEHNSEDISSLISSNILFGTEILEAMANSECKKIINFGSYFQNVGSQSVYMPANLYAATKQSLDNIIQYYSENHDLNFITLKFFDTFGPNDNRNKLVDFLIKSSLSNANINLTNANKIIDLSHITSIIEHILHSISYLLTTNQKLNERFFISGFRLKLKDIVFSIEKATDKKINCSYGNFKYMKTTAYKVLLNNEPPWKSKMKDKNFDLLIKDMIINHDSKK
jgi:nucleoside-diphosphate-sugar epimerase